MRIVKLCDSTGAARVGFVEDDRIQLIDLASSSFRDLAGILSSPDPEASLLACPKTDESVLVTEANFLPPIDQQEVWAAGVTYKRSQTARMEESEAAASCYDRVYQSERPEIFFKATPHRVRGHKQNLRIRHDAKWNVPEPELALVLSSSLEIVGYTVGNDMSSRDIEGDNPLYLPQAKMYDECCGLGPWITLASAMPPPETVGIHLRIERAAATVFSQATSVAEMARGLTELVGWLGRDNSFPEGAFLLTGTGIVPDSDFTLQPDDLVHISIDGIGTLTNSIVQAS